MNLENENHENLCSLNSVSLKAVGTKTPMFYINASTAYRLSKEAVLSETLIKIKQIRRLSLGCGLVSMISILSLSRFSGNGCNLI